VTYENILHLQGEADTTSLGERLSLWARPGMVILLQGDLGSGKSTLARAFIRRLMNSDNLGDVPSPTFSLIQVYDDTRVPVFHADLYRLSTQPEVDELGLQSLLATHCGLVEWPERQSRVLSLDVLHITLSGRGDSRTASLKAEGAWATALKRDEDLQEFLATTPHARSQRHFFEGDASSRRYERLVANDGSMVLLMDMPQRPDGPPVKDGKPYSQIAHLAENIIPVVAINTHLVSKGYSAPTIFNADLKKGLALIEPLSFNVYGDMMRSGFDMHEPLGEAAAVLAHMATQDWPRQPEAAPGVFHTLQDYDEQAQLIEADLLPSWYIPFTRNLEATTEQRESFAAIWSELLPLARPKTQQWTIRDFHSPNLLWIPERVGLKRVGIIDSQDALLGHPAYDLVSMAQDARVDISVSLEDYIIQQYVALRQRQGGFDVDDFITAYAVLGAQRNTKILGIFARLNKRDGKPQYLKHMPRVKDYLIRNLQHKALQPLKRWFLTHTPDLLS
jgi:N-acetylmuramate 1-kinase